MMATANDSLSPLRNLNSQQIDKVLAKLQLIAPAEYDIDGKIELLRCSKVFNHGLADYPDEDILVVFNKRDIFIDFRTTDGHFEGLFCKVGSKLLYPCRVCASDVTDKKDTTGYGLECNGCGAFFHNNCTSRPVSPELFKALSGSPHYVKILCPPCNLVYGSADQKLKRIERKVDSVEVSINSVRESVDKMSKNKPLYSEMAGNGKHAKLSPTINLPPKIVNSLNELTKASQVNEDSKRLKRTRVVVRPEDTNIRTSREIRREFNKNHNDVIIKHCRLTAGGSIMFEFEDEDTATEVQTQWSTKYYGGNKGMKIPGEDNSVGLVKHVYDDLNEEEIIEEIQKAYPGAECEFFKRKDQSFSGLIKVDFKSRETLQRVMNEKIKFGQQRYIVEEYKRKSRVIKCNKCQGWGHIHRYCNRAPKCGKCADKHETMTCTINKGFKCAHCGDDHRAGSSICKVYKEKVAMFENNVHYG